MPYGPQRLFALWLRFFRGPMFPAQGYIAVIAANLDLGPARDGLPRSADPQRHSRFSPAPAQRLYLFYIIGDGEEGRAAGKKFAAKIRPQAIAHDGDSYFIRHFRELPDLIF